MWNKQSLLILIVVLITVIDRSKCELQNYLSDHQQQLQTTKSQARLFGSIVGIIVSNIDWLPIEINVIDMIIGAVSFFSNLLSSTTSAISSMDE